MEFGPFFFGIFSIYEDMVLTPLCVILEFKGQLTFGILCDNLTYTDNVQEMG
jgi:hypothetical protein